MGVSTEANCHMYIYEKQQFKLFNLDKCLPQDTKGAMKTKCFKTLVVSKRGQQVMIVCEAIKVFKVDHFSAKLLANGKVTQSKFCLPICLHGAKNPFINSSRERNRPVVSTPVVYVIQFHSLELLSLYDLREWLLRNTVVFNGASK